MSTYQTLQYFAASWGTAYFAIIFIAALAFALWPSNRQAFDEAARIPLEKD